MESFESFNDVMIDLETIGVDTNNSAVLAICCVVFDINTSELSHIFKIHIDRQSCSEYGLIEYEEQLIWWQHKDRIDTFNSFHENTVSLDKALIKLFKFLKVTLANKKYPQFWANSPEFDLSLLKSYYKITGLEDKIFWNFWNQRDVRTINSLNYQIKLSIELKDINNLLLKSNNLFLSIKEHDPLYDCLFQILIVCRVLYVIRNYTIYK